MPPKVGIGFLGDTSLSCRRPSEKEERLIRPPRRFDRFTPQRKGDDTRINDQIRLPEVRLIEHEGEQVGSRSDRAGAEMAEEKLLDLVEISPTAKSTGLQDHGLREVRLPAEEEAERGQEEAEGDRRQGGSVPAPHRRARLRTSKRTTFFVSSRTVPRSRRRSGSAGAKWRTRSSGKRCWTGSSPKSQAKAWSRGFPRSRATGWPSSSRRHLGSGRE